MPHKIISRLSAIAILTFFAACNTSTPPHYLNSQQILVDSFSVSGFLSGIQNLVQFQYLNDSTFYTEDEASQQLLVFKQSPGEKRSFSLSFKTPLPLTSPYGNRLFAVASNSRAFRLYFGDIAAHTVNVMNEKGKILIKHRLHHQFEHVGSNYNLISYDGQLLFFYGDTLIAGLINTSGPISTLYKEPLFNEFLYTKDTMMYLQSFGRFKKTDLYPYHNPYSRIVDNKIYMIYPFADTLYQFDVRNGQEKKTAIHNLAFIKPDTFHVGTMGNIDFSRRNKYLTQNFSYMGMAYNKRTKHLVLFYNLPMIDTAKNKIPDPMASTLFAITLKKDGTPLKYYNLGSKRYQTIYYSVPRGIAIPRFSNNGFNEKTIKFDVFNF